MLSIISWRSGSKFGRSLVLIILMTLSKLLSICFKFLSRKKRPRWWRRFLFWNSMSMIIAAVFPSWSSFWAIFACASNLSRKLLGRISGRYWAVSHGRSDSISLLRIRLQVAVKKMSASATVLELAVTLNILYVLTCTDARLEKSLEEQNVFLPCYVLLHSLPVLYRSRFFSSLYSLQLWVWSGYGSYMTALFL